MVLQSFHILIKSRILTYGLLEEKQKQNKQTQQERD